MFLYVILVSGMCPFSVTLEHVPDRDLGPLLAQLSEAGFASPIIRHAGADGPSEGARAPVRGVAGFARRLAPSARAGGRVVSVAETARRLLALPRLHGYDARRGRRMYGIGDKLPAVYADRFRTQIYNERVAHPGAWNKVVAVAREDDDHTMLNHAADPEPATLSAVAASSRSPSSASPEIGRSSVR
jgi:hypothetical protein